MKDGRSNFGELKIEKTDRQTEERKKEGKKGIKVLAFGGGGERAISDDFRNRCVAGLVAAR